MRLWVCPLEGVGGVVALWLGVMFNYDRHDDVVLFPAALFVTCAARRLKIVSLVFASFVSCFCPVFLLFGFFYRTTTEKMSRKMDNIIKMIVLDCCSKEEEEEEENE